MSTGGGSEHGRADIDAFVCDVAGVGDEVGGDAGAFVDRGQPAAGVSAAADEVEVLEIFEAVVWAEVEHLVERVREVESRAEVDIAILPIGGSDDAFCDDMIADVFE